MSKASTLSDVIETIYDAGLEPALWYDAVVRIRDFVGGKACGLFSLTWLAIQPASDARRPGAT
jgi:hypothetical protein